MLETIGPDEQKLGERRRQKQSGLFGAPPTAAQDEPASADVPPASAEIGRGCNSLEQLVCNLFLTSDLAEFATGFKDSRNAAFEQFLGRHMSSGAKQITSPGRPRDRTGIPPRSHRLRDTHLQAPSGLVKALAISHEIDRNRLRLGQIGRNWSNSRQTWPKLGRNVGSVSRV